VVGWGGWVQFLTQCRVGLFMARRARNYRQTVTGTKSMGTVGDQAHIGKIEKLDPNLASGFLNNVVVSCQNNNIDDTEVASPFTVYLSNSPSGGWDDDQVITARATAAGGGTVSLTCKRVIRSDTSADDNSFSPIHVWAETADTSSTEDQARFTIEAWGRMIILSGDFD